MLTAALCRVILSPRERTKDLAFAVAVVVAVALGFVLAGS